MPLVIAALLLAPAAAAQPQGASPKAWLESVYARYRDPDFSPFRHPERYFSPKLLAAIKEDSRLAHGEVGYVDADPLCQCQDNEGMRASVVKVTQQGPAKAVAQVQLRFPDTPIKPYPVTFTLVRTKAGWRIADTSSKDEPSFIKAIEKSNREMRTMKH